MDRIELKEKLDKLGISQTLYSLYGERDFNKTILEWGTKWRIYGIDERGGEHEKALFENENEACEYFYSMMYKFKSNMVEFDKRVYVEKPKEKRIFIVSSTGNTNIQKEDR
ncbi:MAG TPA: hypothetical protein VK152_07950 [Paludibacter sp.]|nr:hypothetical protein [Paludibacter sp.]